MPFTVLCVNCGKEIDVARPSAAGYLCSNECYIVKYGHPPIKEPELTPEELEWGRQFMEKLTRDFIAKMNNPPISPA